MKKILLKSIGFILILTLSISCRDNNDVGTQSIWLVADHKVDCIGVSPMRCMLVKRETDQDWVRFYFGIEGFEYTEGYEYKIIVNEREIENPPADASSIRYVLVSILEKR